MSLFRTAPKGVRRGCRSLPVGSVPTPIPGRDRVVPGPPATALSPGRESRGNLEAPPLSEYHPGSEVIHLGVWTSPAGQLLDPELSPQDPNECPEDHILASPGTPLGGAKGP